MSLPADVVAGLRALEGQAVQRSLDGFREEQRPRLGDPGYEAWLRRPIAFDEREDPHAATRQRPSEQPRALTEREMTERDLRRAAEAEKVRRR